MKRSGAVLTLSPSDLANHVACAHLTALDVAVAGGELPPPSYASNITAALRERGIAHESAYIDHLRAQGLDVVDLREDAVDTDGCETTLLAMQAGQDVIVQAPLAHDGWAGRADILRRIPRPSSLGRWSYEPIDTKLAAETKGGTILQLCAYAHMLEGLQGVAPESVQVVTPGEPFTAHTYRHSDYVAYYRFVRRRLIDRANGGSGVATYPEPVAHCDICRWWEACDRQRRADDHLSFIAGIGGTHRQELVAQGVPTLTAAATMPLPIAFKPARGSRDAYARIREQARVQHQQRSTGAPVYEILTPVAEGQGLARLPEPSPGDLFLDLEGARYAREGGREYLFGVWGRTEESGWGAAEYAGLWAFDDAAERSAFEATIDRVMATLAAHTGAHIYHFGHYEPSTLKRLMGRYVSRAEQLDELLRAGRFVDLHGVVRQGLRAGVESYSIKQLEQYYGFVRAMPLRDASAHLHAIELALEASARTAIMDESRRAVQAYNEDDCRSTEALRNWLEGLRTGLVQRGTPMPRPVLKDGQASEQVGELEARQQAARARLLAGIGIESAAPDHPGHPHWLLAYLLDWHRRENKSAWWEYYRLRDSPEAELLDEPQAVAGLDFVERVEVVRQKRTKKLTGSVIDRYRYPVQEVEVGRKGKLSVPGGASIGALVAHDRTRRTLDIRKGPANANVHPTAVFEFDVIPTNVQQEALLRFAEDPTVEACGTDLLFRRPPRLTPGHRLQAGEAEALVDLSIRLALALDRTTLAIQGPPGSGKTYVGAQMIRALARAGKRVGITAVSHKVICNLLDALHQQVSEAGEDVSTARRCPADDLEDESLNPAVKLFTDDDDALAALAAGEVQVLGGTSWLWSKEDAAATVDILFVDEAGQMSLANALAVSGAARSLVLLGDPQQLEQPRKGSHPDGVGVSALEHVLGGVATMPPDRGLFLPVTWRLHPAICAFTSEVFYEGKLEPKHGLDRQRLAGTRGFDGAGLWWVSVTHDGNQNASMEEVEAVGGIVDRLLSRGAHWEDEQGVAHPLTAADLRVVAPYNAQVNRLTERLEATGIPVGTVDKFQGQEAPVVIYSMATSRPEDAPRGMEFLYSLNRLNVATSRARCAAIVVASPRLLEPACRTPRQMRLANAVCRFGESSTRLVVA